MPAINFSFTRSLSIARPARPFGVCGALRINLPGRFKQGRFEPIYSPEKERGHFLKPSWGRAGKAPMILCSNPVEKIDKNRPPPPNLISV